MAGVSSKKDKPTLAEQADVHELYEEAVQNVETEVEFLAETFQGLRGRPAVTFREDFCGTASASCEWVRTDPTHKAVGVDIDSNVLEWGKINRVGRLSESQKARIKLFNKDVMEAETGIVDIVAAFNFSYWIFRKRNKLREYLSQAYSTLASDGLLFLDVYGGPEAYEEQTEKTKHDGFTYIWDQAEFEPVTGHALCHIHFKFPDGSRLKKAFSYEWRIWTLPELREVLEEVGFKKVRVYWEDEDEDGEGSGEYSEDDTGEADLAWIAYVVAEK